ncbi:gluconeogenesis factor YvcK family protein [Anaerosphaera multitolerans]|uniref:Putative gluconeogenesis factor n=1 Tax=Anaerosphaera multitolerans TaxID=2487351 RepID=A0A437S6I0_9FIRM|nr:gluconeogenesis factor YvcK family protein [Anaerosphaera multitolerans]RVU54594.1 YvcK family protein [Anaerosphaera multitolerans]
MNKKVVVIGGGTGISALLKGIKKYTSNITAIVTMTDDGGGSGILRKDLGMLPPGDVRNCLIALANTEPVMEKLLQYRFETGNLEGQNFGNLLIAALCEIYGSFDNALIELENVLRITGKVVPVTLDNVHLVAEFKNGDKCIGESTIPKMCASLGTSIEKMSLFPHIPSANEKAVAAILSADAVLFGPGSLYTSIIPNLIVKGIVEALKGTRAQKIYISNVMTQRGETDDFTLRMHVEALEKHGYEGMFDICMANNYSPRKMLLESYFELDDSSIIEVDKKDIDFLKERSIELIEGDFLENDHHYIRHSGEKIGAVLRKHSIL